MTSDVHVCPKCGRHHSSEEFRESHFCRNCGKLLTRRDKRTITEEVKKMEDKLKEGFIGFFPYSPYPQQLEFMKDAERVLNDRGVLVAEACNGFGKTVCALSVALFLGRKIVYATRTHEQVRQVLQEVEQINTKAETEFSAVSLASRQSLCLNEVCGRLPPLEAIEACNVFRKAGRCPYKSVFDSGLPSSLPHVLSTKSLLRIGEAKHCCPYFLARKLSESCTVVVSPYQYIFNEAVRAKVKLEIAGKILIFDEAHNADKVGQEALSDVLSERGLSNSRRELQLIDIPPTFVDELEEYLENNISNEALVKAGAELRRDLEQILGEDIASFVEAFEPVVDEIRLHKTRQDMVPVCYLNGVLSFLSLVDSSDGEKYAAIYRRSPTGLNLVEYRCLDPSLAIKPVVEDAYSAIIMSGTLSPLKLFTNVIGLEEAETQTYSAIAKPENVHAFIDTSVTTRYKERDTNMLRLYGERVSRLLPRVPNGALIFFPQRGLLSEALNNWTDNGFLRDVDGKLFFERKEVFIEGERATENTRIVDDYKDAARSADGAVLFAVFRSRNAEGSNFPDEEARGVFLVGLPYADYRDPVVRAQIDYFNSRNPGLGEQWYLMDAFRAANQALGRGIRHRDDWCNFFLMDRRYASYGRYISKWATENGIKIIK